MLDQVKLRGLQQASAVGDWITATDVVFELSLESKGTSDEFVVEALELAVLVHGAERLVVIARELTADRTGSWHIYFFFILR